MDSHPLKDWFEEKKRLGSPIKRFELAKSVGCAPSRISQILNGEQPSLTLAAKLSRNTGISVDQFVRDKSLEGVAL